MTLDDDLAAWAAAVRLPEAEAAAIFQRIVTSAAGPSAAPAEHAPAARGRAVARPVVVAPLQRRLHGAHGRQHRAGPARRVRARRSRHHC